MRMTFLGVLVLCCLTTVASAAEWKVGLASVDITPERPVPMAGYASRVKPFERVEQRIFAKAMALEDGEGGRAVLVTMDLLGLPKPIAEPVVQGIIEKTDLKREQILLSWSHTHSAPTVSLRATAGPLVSSEVAQETVRYTKELQEKLVKVAGEAMSKLRPANLAWSSGVVHFPMNRREFTERGVILGVNPRGPVDRTVPVLRVMDEEGKLVGVLFGAACHNTTLTGGNMAIAGDYAGFAQAHIEGAYPGVQAMFMAGCGGDANPYPRNTLELAREHGTALGKEVSAVLGEAAKFKAVGGPIQCAFGEAVLPLQVKTKEQLKELAENGPSWQRGDAKGMLAMMERGEELATEYPIPVAVWRLGSTKDALTLVGISGEVVVDYVAGVERVIGPLNLWVAGYTNESFGYLPSARVLSEGGYECRGLYAGTRGWFAPEAEAAVLEKVKELAARVGRKTE